MPIDKQPDDIPVSENPFAVLDDEGDKDRQQQQPATQGQQDDQQPAAGVPDVGLSATTVEPLQTSSPPPSPTASSAPQPQQTPMKKPGLRKRDDEASPTPEELARNVRHFNFFKHEDGVPPTREELARSVEHYSFFNDYAHAHSRPITKADLKMPKDEPYDEETARRFLKIGKELEPGVVDLYDEGDDGPGDDDKRGPAQSWRQGQASSQASSSRTPAQAPPATTTRPAPRVINGLVAYRSDEDEDAPPPPPPGRLPSPRIFTRPAAPRSNVYGHGFRSAGEVLDEERRTAGDQERRERARAGEPMDFDRARSASPGPQGTAAQAGQGNGAAAQPSGVSVRLAGPDADDDDRLLAATFSPFLANTNVPVRLSGNMLPIDGMLTNAHLRGIAPAQLAHYHNMRQRAVTIQVPFINGRPATDFHQSVVGELLEYQLRRTYGMHLNVHAAPVYRDINRPNDPQVLPNLFIVVGLPDEAIDVTQSARAIMYGGVGTINYLEHEDRSHFLVTIQGLRGADTDEVADLFGQAFRANPAVRNTITNFARPRNLDADLIIEDLSRRVEVRAFDVVLPRSQGATVRQFHVYMNTMPLPDTTHTQLRADAATIVIQHPVFGVSSVFRHWNCEACRAHTHPGGLCDLHLRSTGDNANGNGAGGDNTSGGDDQLNGPRGNGGRKNNGKDKRGRK